LPKLYAIKLISLVFDYIAAWYIWRLARRRFPAGNAPTIVVAFFLFLPTVVLNSSCWGQCDIMYTTGFLASLLYISEGRSVAALIAFGFSFSLKPQAIFFCPLLLALFLNKRLSWRWIWLPAAVYVVCGIPEMVAGRPIWDVLMHWARVHDRASFIHHAPNWYEWVKLPQDVAWWFGIIFTFVSTTLYVLIAKKGPAEMVDESRWLVNAALLSVLFVPFLLPGMHQRYFFAADVISVVYATYVPKGWCPAILIQLASCFSYFPALFKQAPIPFKVLALLICAAIVLVAQEFIISTAKNPLVNRNESFPKE
jgi:Gpi18-like mannosyltransferase